MQIFIFTAVTMLKKAVSTNSMLWLTGAAAAAILIVAPPAETSFEYVSFTVLMPVVFLLTGWDDSAERKGILSIINRGGASKMVKLSEWLFPALASAVISSIFVFAVSAAPPWQFWVAAPLTAVSFSLVYLMTEQHLQYPGRAILGVLWFVQLTARHEHGKLPDLLLFTDYPAAVLLTDPGSGMHHPDSFVLASLIVVFIVAGIHTVISRKSS